MKKYFILGATGLLSSAAMMACAPAAMAHNRVDWSVSIGAPIYYAPPPVVYAPPQAVYVEPQTSYVERWPAGQYRRPDRYDEGYWREHEGCERHEHRERRRHHHDDDDE